MQVPATRSSSVLRRTSEPTRRAVRASTMYDLMPSPTDPRPLRFGLGCRHRARHRPPRRLLPRPRAGLRPRRPSPPVWLAGRRGRRPRGPDRAGADGHRPGRGAGRHRRRVPATAPAQPPSRPAPHDQPRRHLRVVAERGLDLRRSVRGCRLRGGQDPAAGRARGGDRVRGRQVPADGRLRAADRGPDRRRGPGPPRGAPGRRHHRDARGLRQLQRRHPRHLDGGGADLGRGDRRPGLRHRRWRLDHGHPVRRRQAADLRRGALPARRQRRDRDLARRRLHRGGRPVRHRRHQGQSARRPGGQGRWSCRARAGCSTSATRSAARSRSGAGPARPSS